MGSVSWLSDTDSRINTHACFSCFFFLFCLGTLVFAALLHGSCSSLLSCFLLVTWFLRNTAILIDNRALYQHEVFLLSACASSSDLSRCFVVFFSLPRCEWMCFCFKATVSCRDVGCSYYTAKKIIILYNFNNNNTPSLMMLFDADNHIVFQAYSDKVRQTSEIICFSLRWLA